MHSIAEALLTVAYDSMVPFLPADPACGTLNTFVVHGMPSIPPLRDTLGVWATSLGKEPGPPGANSMITEAAPYVANFQVELHESEWPALDPNDRDYFAKVSETSRYLYLHGQTMYQAVRSAIGSGDLSQCGACGKWLVGPLLPLRPQGGMAGWFFKCSKELCDADASLPSFP